MAETDCEATVSYAELAKALDMSRLQARYTVRGLEQEGLIRRQMCFRDDGGQTACLFCVTSHGFTYLTYEKVRETVMHADVPLPQGR